MIRALRFWLMVSSTAVRETRRKSEVLHMSVSLEIEVYVLA